MDLSAYVHSLYSRRMEICIRHCSLYMNYIYMRFYTEITAPSARLSNS